MLLASFYDLINMHMGNSLKTPILECQWHIFCIWSSMLLYSSYKVHKPLLKTFTNYLATKHQYYIRKFPGEINYIVFRCKKMWVQICDNLFECIKEWGDHLLYLMVHHVILVNFCLFFSHFKVSPRWAIKYTGILSLVWCFSYNYHIRLKFA